MPNRYGELKRTVADKCFDAIKQDFTEFDYVVEITRIDRLNLQIKVILESAPPRYFTIQVKEPI